jgi:hypothetical protein
VCVCVCGVGDSGSTDFTKGAQKLMCVCLCFFEVVIVAVLIFTQGAGKLMCVCLCVCVGGDIGSINFYTLQEN